MAPAVGAMMTAVVFVAAKWWEERWDVADAGWQVCMLVMCLSAGIS